MRIKRRSPSALRSLLAVACLAATLIPNPSWSAPASGAEKRYALLIANTSYPDRTLPSRSAANDAFLLKDELQRSGFDVDLRENATPETMKEAIGSLNGKIKSGAVVLIYFTGFGAQIAHQDYLLPVKVPLSSEAEILQNGIGIDDELEQLNRAGARVKIAILDAAYPNAAQAQTGALGLAPINGPDGTLALLSASPGQLMVSNALETSLFMGELLKELRRPSSGVESAFIHTRSAVSRASNGEEVPWVASSLTDEFLFNGPAPASTQPASTTATPPTPTTAEPVAKPPEAAVAAVVPAAPESSNDACDRFAANPLDTTRPPGVAGVPSGDIDVVNAVPACRTAHQTDPNNRRVTYQLARALDKAGDPAALQLYEAAAAAGLALAMNNLGIIYQRGLDGQNKDLIEATRWFRSAADAGLPTGMRNLAWMYVNGNGVAKDDGQALWWFRKAVAGGDADAMNTLGWRYKHGGRRDGGRRTGPGTLSPRGRRRQLGRPVQYGSDVRERRRCWQRRGAGCRTGSQGDRIEQSPCDEWSWQSVRARSGRDQRRCRGGPMVSEGRRRRKYRCHGQSRLDVQTRQRHREERHRGPFIGSTRAPTSTIRTA